MLFYRIFSVILLPVIYLYLFYRLLRNKEDKSRLKERLGFSSEPKPKNQPSSYQLFWVHSVSVGESNSALTLIEKLLTQKANLSILITSTTLTSATQIKEKLAKKNNKSWSKRVTHQFLPIDDFFSVNRFLNYWQPKRAIFLESEIWPNLIYSTKKRNIKLALINGRLSEKSAKKWQFLHKIGFNILQNFQICLAQSTIDKERLINLGLKHTKYLGNLKFCAKPLEFDLKELNILQNQTGGRKFWLAASTHKGEEEIIFKIHQKLKEIHPDLLTIIAPRHPARMADILKITPKNIHCAFRSKKEDITPKTDIYFANTLGELGLFYKLSKVSLICGSLINNIGGHNPYEALNLSKYVISGKYVANFKEAYEYLQNKNLCFIAQNKEDLILTISKFMKS